MNNCVKLFWNQSTNVEVMVHTNLDGCTHIHQTVVVSAMSCSTQAGLIKTDFIVQASKRTCIITHDVFTFKSV